jgi:hypothetical protein
VSRILQRDYGAVIILKVRIGKKRDYRAKDLGGKNE